MAGHAHLRFNATARAAAEEDGELGQMELGKKVSAQGSRTAVATEEGQRARSRRPVESHDQIYVGLPSLTTPPYVCHLQCLFSDGGYTYLDVRPALENEDIGKIKVRGSICDSMQPLPACRYWY